MSADPFGQLVADNKALMEQNAHLRRVCDSFERRIGHLETRDGDQQQWNSEAQKRVNKLEQVTSGTSGRSCPGCEEVYPDGITHWPGYTSRSYPGDPRCFNCFPRDNNA